MIGEASRDSSAQPWLRHAWLGDDFLRSLVEDYFSRTTNCRESGAWAEAEGDLERFGWRCITEVHDLGREAGRREAEPRLIDGASGSGHEREASWRKVDGSEVESSRRVLWTSEAWKKLHALSAEEGLVACAYDKRKSLGAFSRTFQFAKLYMFNASSGLYSCPLAMTDGAARLCEILKEESPDHCPIHERAYPHLVSRDPKSFWTSGQWMTEIDGGSDVGSGCQTMATPIDPSGAESEGWADTKLTGYKWFSSATDANMAFALARESAAGSAEAPIGGSRGLSLFYVEVREDHGGRGGGGAQARTRETIRLRRLKDKLGTRQLPTAELELLGVPAARASRKGRGVARISEMMNITRVHNAITASSYMRRISDITADYASRRSVFGKPLCEQPLAVAILAHFEVHARASLALTMEAVFCLGAAESAGKFGMRDEKAMLRVLTPLAKLFTAKQVVWAASEGLEFFGGQGYIEKTGIPEILRDASVLPIWEGTTSVLCLDVIRAIRSDEGAGALLTLKVAAGRLERAREKFPQEMLRKGLCDTMAKAIRAAEDLGDRVRALVRGGSGGETEEAMAGLRGFSFLFAKVVIAGLLAARAPFLSNPNHVDTAVFAAWCGAILESAPSSVDLGHFDYAASKTIVEGRRVLPQSKLLMSKF